MTERELQEKAKQIATSQDYELRTSIESLILFLLLRYQNIVGVQSEYLYKNMQWIREKIKEDMKELDEYRRIHNVPA